MRTRLAVTLLLTACSDPGTEAARAMPYGEHDAGAVAVAASDQPANIYPAKHHPLPLATNSGGAVLDHMQLVTVTFKGDPWRDDLRNFGDGVLSTTWWKTTTSEYGISPGSSVAHVELVNNVEDRTFDNERDLKPWIQAAVASGALPAPNEQTAYALYFPPTTQLVLDGSQSCRAFRGYHDSTRVQRPDGKELEVAYAALPRCDDNEVALTFTASHEMIEAATDAHPLHDLAWYLWGNVAWTGIEGAEVADMCSSLVAVDAAGFKVSPSWSNAAARQSRTPCQPSPAGAVYFGAAVETEVALVSTGTSVISSDGFVVVARGATRQVQVVVFSEAALPNDLSLVTGSVPRDGDPSAVRAITKGVTASLSRKTAHNGHLVLLTLTVSPDTVPGDYPFVVRAILTPDLFHDWPVILRVP